jgi:hypothetical protein
VNAATGRLAYPRAYLLSRAARPECTAPPVDLPAWAVESIVAPTTYDLRAKKQRQGASQQHKAADHDGAFEGQSHHTSATVQCRFFLSLFLLFVCLAPHAS